MTDSTLESGRICSPAKRTVLGAAGRRIKQTDNPMRHVKLERFYTPRRINGRMAIADGPIKTILLWGIKDLPPYPYHGRWLTLEDTRKFFNVVLGIQLTTEEKQGLAAFLRVL